MGYNWDVTGDVRWLNQFVSGRNELGAALEAGYYLTPNLRMSAGYSLGVADDPNGGRNASGPYLGLTVKLNELFGGFGRQEIAPCNSRSLKSDEFSKTFGDHVLVVGQCAGSYRAGRTGEELLAHGD